MPASASLDELKAYVCTCIAQTGRTAGKSNEAIQALSLDETGLDSLELMEMIMEIEDKFELTIDDASLLGTHTIGQLCEMIISQAAITN
jgi:acyl carrier protein